MIVYAHRGLHGAGVPENTLAAFHAAAAHGWGIETDLRTDADGGIILFHDRVAGDRPVDTLTRAELIALVGYPVPTLDDLLAASISVSLNLEVKTTAAFAALAPYLAAGLPADILISSFIHTISATVAEQHGIESALLLASAPLAPLPSPRSRLRTVVWDFNIASADTLADARRQGYRTIVYGPRARAEHAWLVEAGVDAIITDTPDRV